MVVLKTILFIALSIMYIIAFYFISFYTLFFFITYILFGAYWYSEKFFHQKFKYSKSFYRKEKKRLFTYRKGLIILLNNHFLNEDLKECFLKNKYKIEINEINEKINNFGLVFKPINVIIEQFGLAITIFTIFFTAILAFFFNLLEYLIQLYQNQIYIDWEAGLRLFFIAIAVLGQTYLYYSRVYEWKWNKYEDDREDINKMEVVLLALISWFMLKLKIIGQIRGNKISKEILEKLSIESENKKNKKN